MAMNGAQLGGRTVRVSMAKPSPNTPTSSGSLCSPALQQLTGLPPALAAIYGALEPSALLQAEAQARLLQLPAFNAQLNSSNIQTRNHQKPKKPHHDPGRVQRTVYVESVAASADEQVCTPCLAGQQNAAITVGVVDLVDATQV